MTPKRMGGILRTLLFLVFPPYTVFPCVVYFIIIPILPFFLSLIVVDVGSSTRLFRLPGYLLLYQSVRVEPQHGQAHIDTTVGIHLDGLRGCKWREVD